MTQGSMKLQTPTAAPTTKITESRIEPRISVAPPIWPRVGAPGSVRGSGARAAVQVRCQRGGEGDQGTVQVSVRGLRLCTRADLALRTLRRRGSGSQDAGFAKDSDALEDGQDQVEDREHEQGGARPDLRRRHRRPVAAARLLSNRPGTEDQPASRKSHDE